MQDLKRIGILRAGRRRQLGNPRQVSESRSRRFAAKVRGGMEKRERFSVRAVRKTVVVVGSWW